MFGLPSDRWNSPLLEVTIPALVEEIVPNVPYVVSSPTGGDLPFEPGQGIAHYFGVGAYLRPVADARAAGVRFAAECLSFGNPPEQSAVERDFGSASVAGHHPTWKAGVARDSGTSWDFEDIRDDYVRRIFGVDPFRVRYTDPERYLDYGRAVVAYLMSTVMAEWRCARSTCAGALILSWQDICPGAGWGLLDAGATPKSPWYALRRVLAPISVLLTDEGLAGLRIHVINDRASTVAGRLHLVLYNTSGAPVEEAETAISVGGRSEQHWNATTLLGGFRDLTNAYRFGPPAYDVVRVTLETDDTTTDDFHLPSGSGRPCEPDLGLEARAAPVGELWELTVPHAPVRPVGRSRRPRVRAGRLLVPSGAQRRTNRHPPAPRWRRAAQGARAGTQRPVLDPRRPRRMTRAGRRAGRRGPTRTTRRPGPPRRRG